jgi:hypothetical protein
MSTVYLGRSLSDTWIAVPHIRSGLFESTSFQKSGFCIFFLLKCFGSEFTRYRSWSDSRSGSKSRFKLATFFQTFKYVTFLYSRCCLIKYAFIYTWMAFYGELSVFRLSVSAYFRIQELTECESGSGSGTLFPYNLAKKDRRIWCKNNAWENKVKQWFTRNNS